MTGVLEMNFAKILSNLANKISQHKKTIASELRSQKKLPELIALSEVKIPEGGARRGSGERRMRNCNEEQDGFW